MKKPSVAVLSFTLCIVCMLTGCSNSSKNKSDNDSTVSVSDVISITPEKAAETINSLSNFKTDDNFALILPENIDHISTFEAHVEQTQLSNDFYNDYMEIFEYLLPDIKINDNVLRYYISKNYNSENDSYQLVKDHYESIMNGKESVQSFVYDEAGELGADKTENLVLALFFQPIGSNLSHFNKGKTASISGIDIYPQGFIPPANYFEYISSYSPNDESVYHLADKDISIKDAVDFYESYINSFPFPKEKIEGMRFSVRRVDVYKISDNIYGYNYICSREYEGIPFDCITSGQIQSGDYNYNEDMGSGFMIESNDVDQTYGIFSTGNIENKKNYSEMVSFKNAAKLISGQITQNVEFKLEKAEIVYCQKNNNDPLNEEKYIQDTAAAWKFTLFNPNDNLTYVCYVDAVDGENFRYYTIQRSEEE